MTNEDIIFTAGFFLGEGSVSIRQDSSGSHSGNVSVNQLDREPLNRLQQLWGGEISVFGAYGKPTTWHWQRNSKLALPCLEAILPVMRNWSVYDTERIEKYIEFYAISTGSGPNADWRPRARIVAWFRTCVENHKRACHEYLDACYLKEEVQNGERV